jgi:hypothetical protein
MGMIWTKPGHRPCTIPRGKAHQKACASARVRNSIAYYRGSTGGQGDCAPMVRWLDYDPLAVVVLMFGIGAVALLALSI